MAAGDSMALGAFAEQHGPYALAVLRPMLPGAGEAERVLEEALLECWRGARLYDRHRGHPRLWLLSIARAITLDTLAARRRKGNGGSTASGSILDRLWGPEAATPLDATQREALTLALSEDREER